MRLAALCSLQHASYDSPATSKLWHRRNSSHTLPGPVYIWIQLLLADPRAVHDGAELPQELLTSSCSSYCKTTARMRLLSTLACALVLQSSLKYAHAAPHNPAAENAHHNWTLHQEASSDRLNESEFAWVVQTGRKSAEEAVAAVMVTFLQRASKHAGFVAGNVNATEQSRPKMDGCFQCCN